MEFTSRQHPSSKYKVWLYKLKEGVNDEEKKQIKAELKDIAASHSNEDSPKVCIINASLILPLSIGFSVHSALHSKAHGIMKTDCLNKEILGRKSNNHVLRLNLIFILYLASPFNSIAKSLEVMGVEGITSAFLFCVLCSEDKYYEYPGNANVEEVQLQELSEFTDISQIIIFPFKLSI